MTQMSAAQAASDRNSASGVSGRIGARDSVAYLRQQSNRVAGGSSAGGQYTEKQQGEPDPWAQMNEARRNVLAVSMESAYESITQVWPDVTGIRVWDDGGGGVGWSIKRPGWDGEFEPDEWVDVVDAPGATGDLHDALWDASCGVDFNRADDLEAYAVIEPDYDPTGYRHPTSMDIDRHTGTVNSVVLDLAKMAPYEPLAPVGARLVRDFDGAAGEVVYASGPGEEADGKPWVRFRLDRDGSEWSGTGGFALVSPRDEAVAAVVSHFRETRDDGETFRSATYDSGWQVSQAERVAVVLREQGVDLSVAPNQVNSPVISVPVGNGMVISKTLTSASDLTVDPNATGMDAVEATARRLLEYRDELEAVIRR